MPEEKEAAPAAEPKPRSSMMPVIIVALVVYLGATAGFSLMLGAFDPPPPLEVAEEPTPDRESGEGAVDTRTLAETATEPTGYPHEVNRENGGDVVDSTEPKWLEQERLNIKQQREAIESEKRELASLRRDIEKLLATVQEAKSERITMMAKLYDSMDPEAVAQQIGSIEDRTVVMLLPQMKTRTAAKVMAHLDPKRAAQITTRLLALDQ